MKISWGSPFKKRTSSAAGTSSKNAGQKKATSAAQKSAKAGAKLARGSNKAKAAPRVDQHPYRSVSVYSRDLNCCSAAKRIQGHKFLAAHAPELPLGGCQSQARCACRYRHYLDRRTETRRDEDFGLPNRNYIVNERRARKDRRKTT